MRPRSIHVVAALACGAALAAMTGIRSADAGPADWAEQKIVADDAVDNDGFGRATVVRGDTAFVGAPMASAGGAVYVYTRIEGVWTQVQKLNAIDSPPGADFGYSIALDGETALIGAPFTTLTDDGNRHQGAAYVFTRTDGVWTQRAMLVASDFAAEDQFGNAVALQGGQAFIAAYNAAIDGKPYQGAAYVLEGAGDTWTETQKLVASDGAGGEDFGYAIAVSGSTLLVGSAYAAGTNPQQGAAYVFTETDGTWNESTKLVADDGASFDTFGTALAIVGDTAVIGSPYAQIGEEFSRGAVYVYTGSGADWSFELKLIPSDGAGGDAFAWSLGFDGDALVAGAPFAQVGDNLIQGAAWIFTRSSGSWTETRKLVASDGVEGDNFGYAVAIDDGSVLVGSPFSAAHGGAYIYTRPDQDAIFRNGFEQEGRSGEPLAAPLTTRSRR
jgi:hypothetical protein